MGEMPSNQENTRKGLCDSTVRVACDPDLDLWRELKHSRYRVLADGREIPAERAAGGGGPCGVFCSVWYYDSLQYHGKIKIRLPVTHTVFAVLLTQPQGKLQRTENPTLSV